MKPLDLTLSISSTLPVFPGSPKSHFIKWSTIKNEGYNLELLFLSSHTGTHVDAPLHFVQNGKTIDKIPVSRFVGSSYLIKLKKSNLELITRTDIENFEKKYEKIIPNSNVIFYTGWQKNLKKEYYFHENPGLSRTAALYLASKKVNLVGTDSPSIDSGDNKKFVVHRILSKNQILIVENLANLEKIKNHLFFLVVLPLKLKSATGSPVRAIAF